MVTNIDYTNHRLRPYGEYHYYYCNGETTYEKSRAALVMDSYDPYVDDAYSPFSADCDYLKPGPLVTCLTSPRNYSTYYGLEILYGSAYGLRSNYQSTSCGR